MAEIDLTDRNAVLREVKARVEHFYGKTDGTIDIPGQLGAGVEIIKLAYHAASLPSYKCPHCDDTGVVTFDADGVGQSGPCPCTSPRSDDDAT